MRNKLLIVFAIWLTSCNTDEPEHVSHKVNTTPLINYAIVKEYPHDPKAFTEGLQFVDGKLYESTGQYGASDIRITDLNTGKVLSAKKMDAKYFGEGLTVLNNKIYQLTYREHTGFVYDKTTLKLEKTFPFNGGEGWGMTSDSNYLIYDNGGSDLHFLDATTLTEVKKTPTHKTPAQQKQASPKK